MEEQQILQSELLTLIAFWFVPPLAIALIIQARLFAARGLFRKKRITAISVMSGTAFISIVIGVGLLLISPALVPKWLGVTDLFLFSTCLPVLPLSFVTVTICTIAISYLVLRNEKA